MGVERLVLMLETLERVPESYRRPVDVYVLTASEGMSSQALRLAEAIRAQAPAGVSSATVEEANTTVKSNGHSPQAQAPSVLEAAGDNAPLSAKIRHLRGSDDPSRELSTIPAEVARLLGA